MKIKNKITFISLILLVLLSITCVSATQENANNTLTASDACISEVSASSDNLIQSNESNYSDSQMNLLSYAADDISSDDNSILAMFVASDSNIDGIGTANVTGSSDGDAVSNDSNYMQSSLGVSDAKKDVYFRSPDRTLHVEDVYNGYNYEVYLRDSDGNPLANKQVTITFNGKKQTLKTNSRGRVDFNISVEKAGTYKVSLDFVGDSDYNAISCPDFRTVKVIKWNASFVAPNKVFHVEDIYDGYSYGVTLRDSEGNALANKEVTITFNGVNQTKRTNDNGRVYFNISVEKAGTYDVGLKFAGTRYYYSLTCADFRTITVIKWNTTLKAKDMSLYLDDISDGYINYPVFLKDSQGNALVNKQITLTFNGKDYVGRTDSEGYCYFNLSVGGEGKYPITIKFDGTRYYYSKTSSKTIEVIVMRDVYFVAPNKKLDVGDISGGYNYGVTLRDSDGNALANKKVSITFNGKKQTVTTNNNGRAYFNLTANEEGIYYVTLVFAGDKYNYPNSSKNYRTITVINANVVIVAKNENIPLDHIYFGYNYSVLLKDSNGKVLANKKITLTFNGKKLTGTTNSKGYCYFNLSCEKKGTFDVTISFAGDGNYVANSCSKTIKVTESTNPYGTKAKKAWINADGGSEEMKNAVANLLRKLGWEVHISGTGPGYHYDDYFKVTSDYQVYITLYNGFCAGTIREAYSSSIQNTLKKKGVQLVVMWDTSDWTNPQGMAPYRYGDFTGYTAKKAWDDNFSTSDPTIKNVGSWLKSNNAVYCANPTAEGLVAQFVAGGYFAYSGK